VVVISVLETLLDLPFSFYNTMRIEEKYGFNRSSKKTFFLDEIKGLLIGIVLIAGLVSACILFYTKAGKYFGLFLYLIFALFTVLFSMFSMTFMKIFSRFTPLPAGDLRDRLTQMFTEAGFRLKNIYVSNASLRSTTANAYCTGLGRYKEIVLYDTLVDIPRDEAPFQAIKDRYAHIMDIPHKPNWYDDIQYHASCAKLATPEQAEDLSKLIMTYGQRYVELLKDAAPCDVQRKRVKADAYRDGLLSHGGPATDAFLKFWGPEKTGKLFTEVLFG
jgi:hypothetical protein